MKDAWVTAMIAHGLFPLQERLKGHRTIAARRFLELSQWWSAAELQEYQDRKLQKFIQHIVSEVPYYRLIFKEQGLVPQQIQSVADLALLPFLTKSCIRTHHQALISHRAGKLKLFNTGGSTGEPLQFYLGNNRVTQDVAAKWRATRWWNVDIGDKEIVVWGSPIEVGAQDRLRTWRDSLLRSKLLSAFELSPPNIDGFIHTIQSYQPKMLFGYPSALAVIADQARGQQIRLDNQGIKVAFVTSEKLYPDQQKVIEQVFGCPVANGYGGRDAGFIAHACPAGGMHITAEDIVVEIVNEQDQPVAPGQSGEIVITHLATNEYPFVRYRTGDLGTLDTQGCSCGRGLPLLKEIEGRTTDFLYAEDGALVHALGVIYVLRERSEVQRFKVIQHENRDLEVRIKTYAMAEDVANEKLKVSIADAIQKRLGNLPIRVQIVDDLAPEKNGKFRYVVNHSFTPGRTGQ